MIDLWSYSQRLRRSFCRATSELPEDWTPERPSIGQCHVSALLLERAYGGDVLEGCTFAGQYHYWNLIDGVTVDATRDQFDEDEVFTDVVVHPSLWLYLNDDLVTKVVLLMARADLS